MITYSQGRFIISHNVLIIKCVIVPYYIERAFFSMKGQGMDELLYHQIGIKNFYFWMIIYINPVLFGPEIYGKKTVN